MLSSASRRFTSVLYQTFQGRLQRWKLRLNPDNDPTAIMDSGVAARYLVLGAGLVGISFWSYRRYNSGSVEDQIKLALTVILSSGIGYLGLRYIRPKGSPGIAYCDDDDSDDDELDKKLKELKKMKDQAQADIKESIDKKTEELWETAKEKYMTEALEEAFAFIGNIIAKLKEFGQIDERQFETPMIINLALLKKAQDKANRERMKLLPKRSQADVQQFKAHKKLSTYAANIYDASSTDNKEKQAKYFGLSNPDDIVFTSFRDTDDHHYPKYAIVLDHDSKSVVLTVRGTFSIKDVIIDIVCDDEEFLDGFAHRGILRGTMKILDECSDILMKTMISKPGYKLVTTGHSLGAGSAELLAIEMQHHPGKYVPKDTKIECVALAPPPIYRSTKPVPDAIKNSIHIYINNQDCIPRICLGSIAALLAMVRAIDALPFTNYEKFQMLAGASEKEVALRLTELENTVIEINQDKFPYLDHPGQIHYLFKADANDDSNAEGLLKGAYLVVKEDTKWFSQQIFILERMIIDHLKNCYENALEKAFLDDYSSEEAEKDD